MVQEFPGKVSRNSGNCKISEMRTIQLRILEIPRAKLNGKKTTGKNFRKFGYSSRGCALCWKFLKMLFHLLLEIAENSIRTFWSNGKRPLFSKSHSDKPAPGTECFHITSRRPYWCLKTMKRRPCWCPKPVLWELNYFLMQTLSSVPINLHRCWPREWKHSIPYDWSILAVYVNTSIRRATRTWKKQ